MSGEYSNDEARWQAVVQRDPDADGRFYYGVSSTGIYCRPTCPSRRPRRQHVAFFLSADLAEAAGFRACQRCTPREVSLHQQVITEVKRLLESANPAPTLAELGRLAGFSPYHLQRLFKRATGLSPKEYAAAHRVERLKAGLRAGADVTTALHNAGFESASALYSRASRELGMSPGTYRSGGKGLHLNYTLADTPLGTLILAATESGICALWFGEAEALLAGLQQEFPQAALVRADAALAPYVSAVIAHLNGEQPELDLPLAVKATAFKRKVWAALCAIPYGETRSYQEVAQMIGQPRSVRAVASACAANPVALAVPCHRVVRANGQLSGYRWGVERKRRLLEKERSPGQR